MNWMRGLNYVLGTALAVGVIVGLIWLLEEIEDRGGEPLWVFVPLFLLCMFFLGAIT